MTLSQTMLGVRMLFERISHALLCVVICDAWTCLARFLFFSMGKTLDRTLMRTLTTMISSKRLNEPRKRARFELPRAAPMCHPFELANLFIHLFDVSIHSTSVALSKLIIEIVCVKLWNVNQSPQRERPHAVGLIRLPRARTVSMLTPPSE